MYPFVSDVLILIDPHLTKCINFSMMNSMKFIVGQTENISLPLLFADVPNTY